MESYDFDIVKANGYGFQIEMTHKAWMKGFRISEISIVFEDRQEGTSKMSGNIVYGPLGGLGTLGSKLDCQFQTSPVNKKANQPLSPSE